VTPEPTPAELIHWHQRPTLDQPVLVVALEGWVDAGLGAEGAIQALLRAAPSQLLASFPGDPLLDWRARRPTVRLLDGLVQGLSWPTIELRATHDAAGRDVLILHGPEPDFAWQPFAASIVQLAQELGVELTVGLGAFPAPAPHTRPIRLAATAPPASAELVRQVGTVPGLLEVPAGIWHVLELALGDAGIPAVGLWARVPHYVAGMAFPAASAALLDGLAQLAQLDLDTTELHAAADVAVQRVDELIAKSPEHTAMVRTLERNLDALEGNPLDLPRVPTGDELAEELERYLRQLPGTGPGESDDQDPEGPSPPL
jgi:proteasome assembly chaperone (PAC2) family protein